MDGDFTWLGVAIVIGSMVSLVYYLRVIAAVWMERGDRRRCPVMAGAAPEADGLVAPSRSTRRARARSPCWPPPRRSCFGILPGPLLDLASDAGAALL